MHYEILDERESISKSARLSLSTWMLDILTEYRMAIEALKREPSEDLISRAQVTEIFEAMLKTVTDQKIKIGISRSWQQIKDLPSADRPMVIKCKPFLSEEDFKAFAEQVSDQNVILISHEAEVVSTNTSTNTSTKSTNISTDTSADTVEVVRCKDCRHRIHDEERCLYYCEMYYGQGDVSDDNFCQWGEEVKMHGERSEE